MITVEDIQKRIVEELAIEHLSAEDQTRLVDELGGMLHQRLLLSIFEKIPVEDHEKLKQFITADMEEEISALVHKHVANVGEVIENELATSMKEYKEALTQSTV